MSYWGWSRGTTVLAAGCRAVGPGLGGAVSSQSVANRIRTAETGGDVADVAGAPHSAISCR